MVKGAKRTPNKNEPSPPWGRGKGEWVVPRRSRAGIFSGMSDPLAPALSPKGKREILFGVR